MCFVCSRSATFKLITVSIFVRVLIIFVIWFYRHYGLMKIGLPSSSISGSPLQVVFVFVFFLILPFFLLFFISFEFHFVTQPFSLSRPSSLYFTTVHLDSVRYGGVLDYMSLCPAIVCRTDAFPMTPIYITVLVVVYFDPYPFLCRVSSLCQHCREQVFSE